jgi:DNA polymerase III, delta subunit
MTRINSEINKIIDYSEDNITDDVIKNIVIMDENYEIFELSNAIMDKKVDRTMDLLRNMLDRGDEATAIIGLIYNNFRRAFFCR